MIKAATMRAAEAHLRAVDPRLGTVIDRHGPCTIGSKRRDPFHVLCSSIISQQLSIKAADTIQARVAALTGAGARFAPAHFIATDHEALRSCGLSNAKAKWLRALAEAAANGTLDFAKLRKMDDEAAIDTLDALPGIGRWTAEMFLIFALDRLDLFSLGDVGLRNGLDRLHNGGAKLDDAASLALVARWAPYRSVGSWYLWRVVDGDRLD
ncbi:DNA-3-methyladenine glycosylase [Nevskia sp.]|uniref:DNA-3-methyladenine glycosylase family protein n=1 Tax=Nevskia sp. TaxID=1929292 RepID=UPI0025D4003E|nr:DNA-3-methyladenine glycosylase [Nevskia sp.]